MTATGSMLDAVGLAKRFGDRTAVAGIDLRLDAGRALGLLGPNGAGKTTTVRLLTGLLAPSEGSIRLFGRTLDGADAADLRARIGVQTDTNLYETLSVRENLATWGELFGVPAARIPGRIDELLGMLALDGRADSLVGELSKGMRQKVAIARAVLHSPELLFLDEPTAGLDPEAAAELIDYLRGLIRADETTVVLCTHQLHGLETLCDELGILVGGRLVSAGPVDALLEARWPETPYRLDVGGDPADAAAVVERATGRAPAIAGGSLTLALPDEDAAPALIAALVSAGVPVRALVPEHPTVNDLYFATVAAASTPEATTRRKEAA